MVRIFRNFWHLLNRSRGAGILNIAGLSVAFAVFLAILIQVDYEFSYNTSFPDARNIYRLETRSEPGELFFSGFPKPLFEVIQLEIPELSNSCLIGKGFNPENFTVVKPDGSLDYFETWASYADTNAVRIFGLDIIAGDYRKALTAPGQVLMPQSLAERYFGKTEAVGKTFLDEGKKELTVAAVYRDVPSNSTFGNVLYSASFSCGEGWNQWNYDSYYRIPPGTDFSLLDKKLHGLGDTGTAREQVNDILEDTEILFLPLTEIYFSEIRHQNEASGNKTMTRILLLVGILVLGVAGVNFVNFSIALAPSRIKSLNTQKTFGATNRFLRVCVVSEAVIFALLSVLLGTGFCYFLSRTGLQGMLSASLDPLAHLRLLMYTLGAGLLLGLLAGCYPAFYMTSFSPALVLKGSQALSPRGILLRNTLVVFQYSVAIVFMIGILFVARQLEMIKNRSWGIEKEHVVYLKSNPDIHKQKEAFINELKQNPAVTDITFAYELIGGMGMQHWGFTAMINGKEKEMSCDVCVVAPNYLNFFGIEVLQGDTFVSDRDSLLIVNEAFGKAYGFDPMGKPLIGDQRVGRVVKDYNVKPLQQPVRPLLLMIANDWNDQYYYIKINDAARNEAIAHIRKTVHELAPASGVDIRFLDDHLNSLYRSEERLGSLVNLFGLATVFIALMGVYGLVLFNAKFKAKEIGVRKVNGATDWQMVVFLNRSFLRMVVLSFVIACPLAWYAVSAWLDGFAYKVPLSAGIFLLAGLIILAITLLTVSYQSWKAAGANPVEVLKSE